MTDLELLELLTTALAPVSDQPSAADIVLLHRAIDARTTLPRKPLRVRRRWVLPAVAAFSVLGVSGTAIATTGSSLPRMARSLANGVGLPVDSPQLLDARSRRDTLRAALAHHDNTAIAVESAKLRDALRHLDTDERNQVGNDTDQLLQQADNQIDANNADSEQQTPATPTTGHESNTDDSVGRPSGNQTPESGNATQDPGNRSSDDEPVTTTATTVTVTQPGQADRPSSPETAHPESATDETSAPNVDTGQIDEP